jgi:hypothetical protein
LYGILNAEFDRRRSVGAVVNLLARGVVPVKPSLDSRVAQQTVTESCGTVSREVKFRNGVVARRGESVSPTPVFRFRTKV